MTNAQMFKTAKERAQAYKTYCSSHGTGCGRCPLKKFSSVRCPFEWLDLEYKEELKECPFCGGEPVLYKGDCSFVKCHNCDAESFHGESSEEVIAAWNRRAHEQK